MTTHIIIDTDIGSDVDDMLAILYACNEPKVNVLGITISGGNTPQRARIAKKFLRLLKREDIPIGIGQNLTGKNNAVDEITPLQGIYDIDKESLPKNTAEEIFSQSISKVCKVKEKITIVGIGAFTSIASYFKKNPSNYKYIQRIILMAGATEKKGKYVPTKQAHNCAMDLIAAEQVFKMSTKIPIYIVNKYVSKQVGITIKEFEEFNKDTSNPAQKFIYTSAITWMKRSIYPSSTPYDPLTMTVAAGKKFITFTEKNNIFLSTDIDAVSFKKDLLEHIFRK